MTWVHWSAIGVLAFVLASPYLGNLLHKRRVRLNRQKNSAECAKLEALCNLADEFEAAPTDAERKRVYIKAEALGLCDPPEARTGFRPTNMGYSALDDQEAFHLDAPRQPDTAA